MKSSGQKYLPLKYPAVLASAIALPLIALSVGGCLTSTGAKPSASKTSANTPPPETQPSLKVAVQRFHSTIQPILEQRCYDCHSGADNHTGVAFDRLTSDDSIAANPELWLKVLRNTRSHVMPPPEADQPTLDQRRTLENWIEFSAFGVNPAHLDPGRQAIRRLNRTEYHNTVKDLLGVDFDVDTQFPADDIGYGFDNIGDILNVSPMLLEKCLQAAQTIVAQGVPLSPKTVAVQSVLGSDFSDAPFDEGDEAEVNAVAAARTGTTLDLSFTKAAKLTHTFNVSVDGDYRIVIFRNIRADFNFTPERCIVVISDDDHELSNSTYVWKEGDLPNEQFNVHWSAGVHHLTISVTPTTPSAPRRPPPPPFAGRGNRPPPPPPPPPMLRVVKVQLQGPEDETKWVRSPGYDLIFPRSEAPTDPTQRREYARQVLGAFAIRAYRRPVPPATLDRLVEIASAVYETPGKTFEQGVAQSMVAVLASPRFLFRVEAAEPAPQGATFAKVDEYSLASRLSYFLWSTMPDEELFKLAAAGQLRQNLEAQVKRMLADPRSHALVTNFTGQWLQSREVNGISINVHEVQLREGVTVPNNAQVSGPVRAAMRQEPEAYFNYIMQNDQSINEFLDSDYTFLNKTLADFYKIPDVTGNQMHKVTLPKGDLRGGTLTMGATLMVTSNPTRTSPVKRGKWVLENLLGAPTPPPPPDIPPLEQAENQMADQKKPTLRQILATHRANPQCASCHDRMDPIGLALENFNAEGLYRKMELDQPIDPSGQLFTGETFQDVTTLKQALVQNHLQEFYRCLTEKMMIYATGRGMEYYDMPTIDKIVEQLNQHNGRFSALLLGVIDSAPFQEKRVLQNGVIAEAK